MPTYYLLTECNSSIPPFITDTDLSAELMAGDIIKIAGTYANYCFSISVTTTPGTTPVTVVRTYSDCTTCDNGLFLLTDCNNPGSTTITYSDLSAYVGMAVNTNVTGEVCLTVSAARTNPSVLAAPITVTNSFADCLTCNAIPPVDPTCYNLIACSDSYPSILGISDSILAPYVGQLISINGDPTKKYTVKSSIQYEFRAPDNAAHLCAGDPALPITFNLTSLIFNGVEQVTSPYNFTLTSGNIIYYDCTGTSCVVSTCPTANNYNGTVDFLNAFFTLKGLPLEALKSNFNFATGFIINTSLGDSVSINLAQDFGLVPTPSPDFTYFYGINNLGVGSYVWNEAFFSYQPAAVCVSPIYGITSVNLETTCLCYTLQNCENPTITLEIATNLLLTNGSTIELSPAPTAPTVPVGTPNCWSVVSTSDCTGSGYVVDSVITYNNCADCLPSKTCYALTKCGEFTPSIYTQTNLAAYVGFSITSTELGNDCYTVTTTALCVTPISLTVGLISICTCPPAGYCYTLQNCQNFTITENVNSPVPLTIGSFVSPNPAPTLPPGTPNCWVVYSPSVCTFGDIVLISTTTYESCIDCQTPPPCYKLTSCDGSSINYTNTDLSGYVNTYVSSTLFPGVCYYVTLEGNVTCPGAISIPTASLSTCACPCYVLTDCNNEQLPIYTNTNLASYIGTYIHIDAPYGGGCEGTCFLVSISDVPCVLPVTVTVSPGCDPCPVCKPTVCYDLIDCVTGATFMKLQSPTLNLVDLAPLAGTTIGKVCIGDNIDCTVGCWTIQPSDTCEGAVQMYVYDNFENCNTCLNSCYEFVSCTTSEVAYTFQYTSVNPAGLPALNLLVGSTLTNVCITGEEPCPIDDCFFIRKKDTGVCTDALDYSNVLSFDISSTYCCLGSCYLLTSCDGSVEPFTVSNDFSMYVDQYIKVCIDNICKCYKVSLAQSCDSSIAVQNVFTSFLTCDECNYCGCPEGYEQVGTECQKIVTLPATLSTQVYKVASGTKDPGYGVSGTAFYSNITNRPFPISEAGGQFLDASSIGVSATVINANVWGNGLANSRLNIVGVWPVTAPNPLNEWIGFTHCLSITENTTYCIGVAADDNVRVFIDGVNVILASANDAYIYNYWHVFEITLTPGQHIIEMQGLNYSGTASFGAEIYQATSTAIQALTTSTQLQAVTVFSTFNKIGHVFDTGEVSGYVCPIGYSFSNCSGTPECVLIESIPYVECAPTYTVSTCSGEVVLPTITTNTDLSAYVGGTYKVCITNPEYKTDCFRLIDCNKIVDDIYTYIDLTTYLWQSVTLFDYPGSCFIVQGMPIDSMCPPTIAVVVNESVVCNCTNAYTPWPDGCYCVTVEQVASSVAMDFNGTFTTQYTDCVACLQQCYVLQDCSSPAVAINVCNDLSQYVDKVIKITGCGDICWIVSLGDCDASPLYIQGEITVFEDCLTCLPPAPEPTPLVLHPRAVKPGYYSPNSDISVEYIEKVSCTFAKLVYDKMLENRYGITTCCQGDLPKWDIKMQYLQLSLLYDPSLCKSTLNQCLPPINVTATLTITA